MKIGIIYCAYQAEDLLHKSLTPWMEACGAGLGGAAYSICAVSVPFEGFPQEGQPDNTRTILGTHAHYGRIDHVVVTDKPVKETDARGNALAWLVDEAKVDLTIMVDSDEIWTEQDILRVLAYVEQTPFTMWYKLCYRNMVFTPQQYLAEPFTPPRIYRTYTIAGYKAKGFWDDNNVYYIGTWAQNLGLIGQDIHMPYAVIPKEQVWIEHRTWLSDERSRRKVEYQRRRWGHCSFKWDYATNSLQWDEAYYAARGLPLPEVISIDGAT